MFKPIVVRQLDNGTLQIIGGEHRALVAKQMKVDKVPAFNLGKISDVEAKEIGLLDNGRYGSDDALKIGRNLCGHWYSRRPRYVHAFSLLLTSTRFSLIQL
ncbi:ParB/RepB/Spo0J family partition protein [Acinetobacter baumannii]